MATSPSYHKVFKNSFILTFMRIIEPLLAMVVIVAISRLRGAEVMGGYAFLISFIAMFSLIGQMGLQTLITREVAAHREDSSSYLYGALLLGLASSVLLTLVMHLSKGYFRLSPELSFDVSLMSLNLFPIFVTAVFDAVFMGLERSDLIIYQNLTGNLVRVVLSLLFIWLGLGLAALVVAVLVSTLVSVAVSSVIYFKYLGKATFRISTAVSWRLLKSSPTFLLITLVWIMWARVDMLMLTRLANMTQVGLYAAAYKLFEATMIVPQSYVKASFPHLSAMRSSGAAFFQKANRDMLRYALFYVFPAAAAVAVLAPLLISLLYGSKFSASAAILRVLMLALIPWTMGRIFANIIVAANLQRYDLYSGACAACVSIGVNLLAIPAYGAMGAAIAGVSSLSVFFLCQYYFSVRAGYRVSIVAAAKHPLALGAAVFAALWVAALGWRPASCEAAALVVLGLFYLRRPDNRRNLMKPFILLQEVMRA